MMLQRSSVRQEGRARITAMHRLGRKQPKAAEDDREIVARLVREGTLKQYVRDVEAEARAAAASLGAEAAAE